MHKELLQTIDRHKLLACIFGENVIDKNDEDSLGVALCYYFENHQDRPEDDPEDCDYGWGEWALEKENDFEQRVYKNLAGIIGPMERKIERLRVALWSIYEDDQHPNYKDPITPILGKSGKVAWEALQATKDSK